ncbi:MAG: chemotaxis protein CheC [Euryarchaeota archaeon]|nr:chemotaxis protein CheC [Euryarchaeota archaeon]
MEPPSTVDPRLEPLVDLGNIGSLEATVSLSRLATESVNISVGRVDLLPMAPLESLLGGPDRVGVMVVLDTVEVRGKAVLLLPLAGAAVLARLLQAGDNLSSPVAQSALGEVGNILAHAYLNSFSGVLRRTLTVAPPEVAAGSPALLQALLPSGPSATLHIEARVASHRGEVPFHLYFLLDPRAIGEILDSAFGTPMAPACPACGREVDATDDICPGCGKPVATLEENTPG